MPHPDIHIGRDGWLFLTGGSNRALDAYRPSLRTWWRVRRWRALVVRRQRLAVRLGVRFFQTIVPEKLTVHDDRLDGLAVDVTRSPAICLREAVVGSGAEDALIDLAGPLRRAREGEPLYHRTDTHWTAAGCLLAYREICRAAGLRPVDDLAGRSADEVDLTGDLGAKLDPPRSETVKRGLMIRDARQVWANEAALALQRGEPVRHSGAHAVFVNDDPRAEPRHVLLFGDSCAHVHPFLLTGMLAETVRRLEFVWSGSVDWTYVAEVRPDFLICELAERFMGRVPGDTFRLNAERPPQTAR